MGTISSLATDERTARIILATAVEPGDLLTGRVVALVGVTEALRLVDSTGRIPRLDPVEGEMWRHKIAGAFDASTADRALQDTADRGLRVVVPGDREWPTGLADLGERAPIALWVKGDVELLAAEPVEAVTITGMRAATAYGETVASELSATLCEYGRIVVAGGGYGIDQAVHSSALAAGGRTVAVLASGVDRLYPPGNEALLQRIGETGLLVSELPPGSVPTRSRFLQRHRILAGLSGATVLVEAAPRSGALNTAKQAVALGRPVGAVPGPVTSVASVGPHILLRDGIACLVSDARDVEDLLELPGLDDLPGQDLPGWVDRRQRTRGAAPSL